MTVHTDTRPPTAPPAVREPDAASGEPAAAWQLLPLGATLGPHTQAWDALAKRLDAPEPTRSPAVETMLADAGVADARLAILAADRGETQALLVVHPCGDATWTALTAPGAPYSAALVPDAAALPALLEALPHGAISLRVPLLAPGLLRGPLPPPAVRALHVRLTSPAAAAGVPAERHRGSVTELRVARRGPAWCVHGEPMPATTPAIAATVSVHGDLAALPDDVQALFARAERWHGAQASLAWLRRLHEAVLHREGESAVFVLRVEDRPVAALPLHRAAARPAVVQPMRNYYTALFAPPIEASVCAENMAALIDAVHRHWPAAREWRLDPMDPHGFEFRLLQAALDLRGCWTFGFFRFGNWFLPSEGLDWATYIRSRKASLRSTISRMSKRLAAVNGRVELICAPERAEAGLAAYEQVYARSWKQSEPHVAFVRALVHDGAAAGTLRLGIVWVGDTPVAAQIWIVDAGRAEIFKVAYDEEHKALTPGTVLTAHLLEYVLDADRVTVVDYLSGDDAYKRVWMDARRERWGLVAHRVGTPRGWAQGLREAVAAGVRRWRGTGRA